MSLSKFLHKPEYITQAAELDFLEGRKVFGDLAMQYASENPDYFKLIESNLKYFSLPGDKDAVESSIENIGWHYHEKFMSFSKPASFYPDFLKKMIKPDDMIDELMQNQEDYQPTVLLSTHFGAMPLIVGLLNYCKLDISCLIRFPSEEFKNQHETRAKALIKELGLGRMKIYDAQKNPMMKIGSALEAGNTIYTVLDEHTEFSHKVNFLGKTITGGAGIDKIIDMVGKDKVALYFIIMVREGDNYRLSLEKVDLNKSDYIQQMFTMYEKYVSAHYEQWFFLQEVHENIPEHQ